ncbi:hypothetical protein BZG36_05654, partial [Bifiguratus adelaidae]
MGQMDVDDNTQKLELKFILLNEGLAHGDPTFRTITISSSSDLSQLRKAIQAECSRLLKDIDPASLKVYKTNLNDFESDVLLQQLEAQKVRIDVAKWRTTVLRGLALLSDYFANQPDKRAIHLVVDCTAAVSAVVSATEPRWSIDEQHQDIVVQNPNPQHSEYRAISSLNIPSLLGKPSLLMHNLPRNGTGGVVDVQGFTNSLESGHQLGVIVGASGSGKSRTAIEILCRHFGFYFTCATGGTQHAFGSKDMQHMFESIKTRCSDPQKVVENDNYATRFATCVVLTRVYILCYLLKSEIQL